MRRNHIVLILSAILITVFMGSCDSLFTNQFKTLGLGQVSKDSLTTAAAAGDFETLIAESGLNSGSISPSFLAAATVDQATADSIVLALQNAIDENPGSPEIIQASEALIIQIELETSGGKKFIDNIVTAIGQINFNNFNPVGNPNDLASLLSALFPPKALPAGWTQAEIASIINAIYNLDGNLSVLVANLDAKGQYLVSGIDAGWLAQVGAIVTILHQVTPLYSASLAPANIGDSLAALIDIPANWATYVSFDPNTIVGAIGGNTDLMALFAAANLDLAGFVAMFGG